MWILWATAHAFIYGAVNQLNRYWKVPGHLLVRWRCLVPGVAALGLVAVVPPPLDPVFYAAALASALMVPPHDSGVFNISARHGAAVPLRLRSLVLPLVFLAWLVLDSKTRHALAAHPFAAGGIVLCIAFSSFFLFRLKRCAISRAAMKDMIPIILMGAAFDITNKTAMDHAAFPQNIIYYMFIVSGFAVVFGFLRAGRGRGVFVREMSGVAGPGAVIGLCWIALMVTKNLALMHTSNPAYVTAVTLTAPFWASLITRLRGEKEEADWLSGTALVLSVIALAILSGFLRGVA